MSSGSPNRDNNIGASRRLELNVNPEDGSLLTAELQTVLLAATDGLYMDLYNVAHGELDVTTAQQGAGGVEDGDNDEEEPVATVTQKKERMSNMSFAQRRHELAWRLAQHGRALTHVAALTAAAASTDISNSTRVSTRALKHARTAWVQADEAQDAMYFFHAQLFPARQSPHDVYGALDLQILGSWLDMPTDLLLTMDRYDASRESEWNMTEVAERWRMAVQDKLLKGEVAWMRRRKIKPSWKISLRSGILKITHGAPKRGNKNIYPFEALLTVLSTTTPNEWTLLSIDIRVQAKTGENNHQLEASNRQKYDLHRLCVIAMAKEEARTRREAKKKKENKEDQQNEHASVARPLHRLFEVAHTFALSWQLEILSAQAQTLKRENWAAGHTKSIIVTPVEFLDNGSDTIGAVSISFWKVDDQYGPPCVGDIDLLEEKENDESKLAESSGKIPAVKNQLFLSIRAVANVGIKVSMSGAKSLMGTYREQKHIQSNIESLLDATSNPFALSASDALLAATRLCSELKCHAIVSALQPKEGDSLLPSWMHLSVERNSIAVAGRVKYHGIDAETNPSGMAVLFRLTCDARTGSFISIFSRSTWLLRMVACNDLRASESTSLQILSLPQNRRRVAGSNAIWRVVRHSFEGLCRSMNVLGQRVGVGGEWQDIDNMSSSLRSRAVHSACDDTRVSLIKCCGMAAIYGLSALALGIASGITVTPDMAGEIMDEVDGVSLLPTPPVSVLLDQELIETTNTTSHGERKVSRYIKQHLFALGCHATVDSLTIYPADVTVHLISPTSVPKRVSCSLVKLVQSEKEEDLIVAASKRRKLDNSEEYLVAQDLNAEVKRFTTFLTGVLG